MCECWKLFLMSILTLVASTANSFLSNSTRIICRNVSSVGRYCTKTHSEAISLINRCHKNIPGSQESFCQVIRCEPSTEQYCKSWSWGETAQWGEKGHTSSHQSCSAPINPMQALYKCIWRVRNSLWPHLLTVKALYLHSWPRALLSYGYILPHHWDTGCFHLQTQECSQLFCISE